MAGKRSVFECHVEKIYVKTLGEMQYVPGYAGVSQRAIGFPRQRFPTLHPSPGQRKLSERKLEDQLIVMHTTSYVITGVLAFLVFYVGAGFILISQDII